MLAKKYKSEVVSIENPFEGIYTLELKSLKKRFKYQPGQFLHMALDEEYDGVGQWPESRCFSIQSNPSEENIKITYSVKGEFTRQMARNLVTGRKVWLKLPYGEFFQQYHNKENTVFIAGGTGITPFLSLFTHASFSDYVRPKCYLGFSSEKYNIYKEELQVAQEINDELKIQYFFENSEGIIDIINILNKNGRLCSYCISGPPLMIKSFKTILRTEGVGINNILTDEWE